MEFREKIEGKSKFTRGLFISISGYSEQAKKAIVKGKIPVFFCLDGFDLCMILSEDISLQNFLRIRLRLLTEEGDVFPMYQKVARYREKNLTSALH